MYNVVIATALDWGESIMRKSNKHVIHNSDGSWELKPKGPQKF